MIYEYIRRKIAEWFKIKTNWHKLADKEYPCISNHKLLVYVPKGESHRQHGYYLANIRLCKDCPHTTHGCFTKNGKRYGFSLWGWSYFEEPEIIAWKYIEKYVGKYK